MIGLISAMWLTTSAALAQDAALDHRRLQDVTAFTVPQGTWRVGVFDLDYGLSDNTSIGIQPAFWIVGPNIKAKSTVLDRERLAISVGATRQRVNRVILAALTGNSNTSAEMTLTPLSVLGSWKARPKWSLHLGYTQSFTRITGELTGRQIDELLAPLIGSNSGISDALGGGTLYASAEGRLSLNQTNFAVEWRRSETTSWIFESNTYVRASGLVVGAATSGNDTASGGVGASAVFEVNPSLYLGSAVSVAWHRQWERFNLRLGIPLNIQNPLSYTQAIQFYWLL